MFLLTIHTLDNRPVYKIVTDLSEIDKLLPFDKWACVSVHRPEGFYPLSGVTEVYRTVKAGRYHWYFDTDSVGTSDYDTIPVD